MTISDSKRELLGHLKEIIQMEGTASAMYTELAKAVHSTQLKAFFSDLAEEEKQHARLVNELIILVGGDVADSFYRTPFSNETEDAD